MSTYTVQIKWPGDSTYTAYATQADRDYSYDLYAGAKDFRFVKNTFSLALVYTSEVALKLLTLAPGAMVPAYVTKDGSALFTGYLLPIDGQGYASWKRTTIPLTIQDPSLALDTVLASDLVYSDHWLSSPAHTASSLLHKLFAQASQTVTLSAPETGSGTMGGAFDPVTNNYLSVFAAKKGDNLLETLTALIWQQGFRWWFDADGVAQFAPWTTPSTASVTFSASSENVIDGSFKIDKINMSEDSVEVEYAIAAKADNVARSGEGWNAYHSNNPSNKVDLKIDGTAKKSLSLNLSTTTRVSIEAPRTASDKEILVWGIPKIKFYFAYKWDSDFNYQYYDAATGTYQTGHYSDSRDIGGAFLELDTGTGVLSVLKVLDKSFDVPHNLSVTNYSATNGYIEFDIVVGTTPAILATVGSSGLTKVKVGVMVPALSATYKEPQAKAVSYGARKSGPKKYSLSVPTLGPMANLLAGWLREQVVELPQTYAVKSYGDYALGSGVSIDLGGISALGILFGKSYDSSSRTYSYKIKQLTAVTSGTPVLSLPLYDLNSPLGDSSVDAGSDEYFLNTNAQSVGRTPAGVFTPAQLIVTSMRRLGGGNGVPNLAMFRVWEFVNGMWVNTYESTLAEASISYTPSSDSMTQFKVEAYGQGGFTALLAQRTLLVNPPSSKFLGCLSADPDPATCYDGDWYYNTSTHTIRSLSAGTWANDSDSGKFSIAAPAILTAEGANLGGNTPAITYVNKIVGSDAFFDAVQGRTMDVTGRITATEGMIAGWLISGSAMIAGTGSNRVGIDAGGSGPAFYAGSETPALAPFQVAMNGALKATSGLIAGWTIGAALLTGGLMTLDSSGKLWAGHATFGSAPFSVAADGSVKATSGTIGGISLSSSSIYGTDFSLTSGGDLSMGSGSDLVRLSSTDATYRAWVGNATAASAPFRISKTGAFVSTQATITGDLTANTLTANTSGTIAGWTITSTALQSGASGAARLVLDKALMRVSVDSSSGPVAVMGYLSGLLKNGSPWSSTKTYAIGDYVNLSGVTYKAVAASTGQTPPNATYWAVSTDTWSSSEYGFWAKQGQYLRIDGDVQVTNGDWIIARDASYLIKQGATVVTRLGMKDGNNGLYINETNSGSSYRSWMTSSGFFVGNDSAYLSFAGGSLSLLLTSFKVATSLTSVLGSLEVSTTGTISALTNQLTLSASATSGTINHPVFLSLYGGSSGTVGISGAATGDVGLSIYYGDLSSSYGRIRFFANNSNQNNILSFATAWNGGSGGTSLTTKSSGAINLDGFNGVTIGSWNAADLIVAKSGTSFIRKSLYLGQGSSAGATATPDFLNLGATYSNGTTRDKIKVFLYDDGGSEKYGFGIGSSADLQYHSTTSHDFYLSNSNLLSLTTSLVTIATKSRVTGGFTVRPGSESNYSQGIRVANANDSYSLICLGASTSADVAWNAGMWVIQKDPSGNFAVIGPNTANSGAIGFLSISKGGNLQLNTDVASYVPLNIGSASFSWAGSTIYPTLYGNSSDRWMMITAPHIPFLRNGVRGHTGGTFGATIRFEMGTGGGTSGNYWDIGVGSNGNAEDVYSIGRLGTSLLSVTNAGNLTVAGSISAVNVGSRLDSGNAGTVSAAYTFPGLNHVGDTFAIWGQKSGTHFITIPANHIGTGFYTNGSGNYVSMDGAGSLSFNASTGPFYCIYTRTA